MGLFHSNRVVDDTAASTLLVKVPRVAHRVVVKVSPSMSLHALEAHVERSMNSAFGTQVFHVQKLQWEGRDVTSENLPDLLAMGPPRVITPKLAKPQIFVETERGVRGRQTLLLRVGWLVTLPELRTMVRAQARESRDVEALRVIADGQLVATDQDLTRALFARPSTAAARLQAIFQVEPPSMSMSLAAPAAGGRTAGRGWGWL